MSRPVYPPQLLSWLFAGALTCIVFSGVLCSCAALRDAAPVFAPILSGAERVLQHELDRAADETRRKDLERMVALLEEARASQEAAEAAARRAAEAAALAHEDAERAARERLAAEQATRDAAARQFGELARKLRLAEKLAAARAEVAP